MATFLQSNKLADKVVLWKDQENKPEHDADAEEHCSCPMMSEKEYEKEVRADLVKVGALCAVILGVAGLLFVFFVVP